MTVPNEHRHNSPKSVRISLITVSTSRFTKKLNSREYMDESMNIATKLLINAGHNVVKETLVKDDPQLIRNILLNIVYDDNVDAIFTMGGTGITKNDVTIETVRPLFDKEIEGFGETFRMVSYQMIGTSAYLTRATAGTLNGKVIYCLPGSPDAVKTALEIIIPELTHAVYVATS